MLTVNDLEELETYMRSGELEADFKDGCENDRFYLLELLEKLMDVAELADATATRLISGACRCRRLPPNNSRLEQLTLEMLVYGEKRPPTRISRPRICLRPCAATVGAGALAAGEFVSCTDKDSNAATDGDSN